MNDIQIFNKMAISYDSLRPVDNLVLKRLLSKVPINITKGAILDLCCGTGRYSIEIAKQFSFDLVGIDQSAEMIESAIAKYPKGKWINEDIFDALARFKPLSFDILIFSYCFHLLDWKKALMLSKDILKKKGTILILTYSPQVFSDTLYHSNIPELRKIDENRFPNIKDVGTSLGALGYQVDFDEIKENIVVQNEDDVNFVIKKANSKYCSTLWAIEDSVIQKQIKKMKTKLLRDVKIKEVTFIHKHTLITCMKND